MGKLEAAKSMKGGFIVTLIISVTFHALDLVLRDEATWHDFVAGVAVDMAVVAATIAVTGLALMGLQTLGAVVAGVTAAPLIVVVIVGGGATLLSIAFKSEIDQLVNILTLSLRDMEEKVIAGLIKINPQKVNFDRNNNNNLFKYLHQLFGVPFIDINLDRG
ncbi:hypothetical protein [Pseudoalteromonas sp. L21]|uniref:hypothetical protein n=1 Tax=Pseudoalteromonas sp. L21 TaxID=1539746 RepID=UPI001F44ACC1|nr:hypothetical protein [Pseudoalteromonas sp. L21]